MERCETRCSARHARGAVKAIIAQREKDERERKAEAERERRRAEKAAAAKKKEKERAFKTLDALPEAEQEKRLDELARSLDEDPATVREEFATSSSPPVESKPELWPETVDSAKLLADLVKQIRRYVVIREDGMTAASTLYGDVLDPQRGRHAQPDPRRHVFRS